MKQKEKKVASEVQIPKKWKANIPIYLTIEFQSVEKDREAIIQQVLEATQMVTKFQIVKLGEPIFEELGEN